MKRITTRLLMTAIMLILGSGLVSLKAQNFFQGQTKLTIVGNAQIDYVSDSSQSQFRNLAFKPIFLWTLSDKLFIESEIEFATGKEGVEIVLEYANMVYFVNQHLALHGGRFLPKFGAFRGRFGEAYLQKLATNPVGFGDGGIGPMTETGVGFQGGAQLGLTKINYDFYLTNGPQLLTSPAGSQGQFEYEAYVGNNKGKAMGGRFGFLPFSNSSLEIGYSFMYKKKTGDIHTSYEPTAAVWQAYDLNYVKDVDAFKSIIRILAEWKSMQVETRDYLDTAGVPYTFDNTSTAFYVQPSIRPSQAESEFFRNLELVARYSEFNTPNAANWGGGKYKQSAFGLNYWYRWNGVLKFTWQKQFLNDSSSNSFVAQLVYGF